MNNKLRFIYTLLFCLIFIIGYSQTENGTYSFKTHELEGASLNFRIMYPLDFSEDNKYPVFIFMHGMGERGTDNKTQLTHGSKLFQDSLEKYPAIYIFPQCPPTDYWANLNRDEIAPNGFRQFYFNTEEAPNPTMKLVIDLIQELKKESFVDLDRMYLSGLSMGAMGVWEMLWRMPETWAVAAPICGAGPLEKAITMKEIPIWIFHGLKDKVVDPRNSIRMLQRIQKEGGKAKITLYREVGHNAWDYAFSDRNYLSWIFAHKKSNF